MSYRHGSYRKMSRSVLKARASGTESLNRAEKNRVLHWSGLPVMVKPKTWGRPKARP